MEKRSLKYKYAFLLLIIIGAAYVTKENWMPEAQLVTAEPLEIDLSTSISRANAAKLIAYTFYDKDEIANLERNIEFEDTIPTFWYDKYINAVTTLGYMEGVDNKFYPTEMLTYKQVVDILSKVSGEKYNIKIRSKDNVADQKISMQRFIEIYSRLIGKLNEEDEGKNPYKIKEEEIIVLATPSTNEELGAWELATDKGTYGFEGVPMDAYIDEKIRIITKNKEVLGVVEVTNTNPSLESAYVASVEEDKIEILIGGVTKIYNTNLLDESYMDKLVDLHFENGKIIRADIKKEAYKDKVLRVNDKSIETENAGMIPVREDLKIYDSTEDGLEWKALNNIVVGTKDIEYTMKDGKINTITIKKKPKMESIRLLLTTTEFEGKIHEDVEITSSQAFEVDFYGDKKTYQADEIMDIKSWSKKMTKEKPRIKISSLSDDGLLQVKTIKRRDKEPLYTGSIEVSKEEDGGYTLINEVSIEDYVAAVIPSEMPTSFGLEACKVQAIVARSYASIHSRNNKFGSYGANLDDSTNSQVYNNIPADEISLSAARETAGQVILHNDQVVSANCFSTSAGYTANYGEVWAGSEGMFPANTPVHSVSKKQYEGEDLIKDMEDEGELAKFLKKTATDIDAFDNKSPWFRWQLTMSADELTKSVNAGIKNRYKVNPELIKTLDKDRVFRAKDIEDIGQVEKVQIHKRGEGGNIMEVIFYGSKDTIKVATEYNVRTFFAPLQRIEGADPIVIKRQDASEIKNYDMLPSAFFTMEPAYGEDEKLKSVTIYGGGFGHGVGMSQDGVKGMVDRDYNHLQILEHYFPETRVGSF